MPPTSRRRETGRLRLFVTLVRPLVALGLCVAVWLSVCRRTPVAGRFAGASPRQTSAKHASGKVHFDVLAKLLADDRRSTPAQDWLRELAGPQAPFRVETQSHPLGERTAPDFTRNDQEGRSWNLHERRGRGPVVVVFYLGYACDACVSDLFELNTDLPRFHSLGAEVVAVSGDAADLTRQRFEQYGAFAFPVLSDPGHVVARTYGTFRPASFLLPQELLHGTFLIDRGGRVRWAHCGARPFRNNRALLYELARLENRLPEPEPVLRGRGEGGQAR